MAWAWKIGHAFAIDPPTVAKKKKQLADYSDRIVAKNRRASFDYELGDKYEAGLSLMGSEARSLRLHAPDLSDSWVDISNGEAFVRGLKIPLLAHAAVGHLEEKRPRKLLLHQKELIELSQKVSKDGMTIIVTQLHFKGGRAKLGIATGRGKKNYDKRQALREKDAARDARTMVRHYS